MAELNPNNFIVKLTSKLLNAYIKFRFRNFEERAILEKNIVSMMVTQNQVHNDKTLLTKSQSEYTDFLCDINNQSKKHSLFINYILERFAEMNPSNLEDYYAKRDARVLSKHKDEIIYKNPFMTSEKSK